MWTQTSNNSRLSGGSPSREGVGTRAVNLHIKHGHPQQARDSLSVVCTAHDVRTYPGYRVYRGILLNDHIGNIYDHYLPVPETNVWQFHVQMYVF